MGQSGSGSSRGRPGSGAAVPRIRGWRTKPLDLVPEREATARLTLDFSGPPLPLPTDVGDGAQGKGGPTAASGHDAWAIDHVRRSTPPPMQVLPGWLDQGLEQKHRSMNTPAPSPGASTVQPVPPGTAFDLVDKARPSYSGIDLHAEMADRFALGDFSGALGIAELILGTRANDLAALRYAEASREKLEQFYESRFGTMKNRVRVAVRESDVRWLGLDHRAGFLLSRVDGTSTIEELIDTSGMPRLEALRTLSELLDQRAIQILTDSKPESR